MYRVTLVGELASGALITPASTLLFQKKHMLHPRCYMFLVNTDSPTVVINRFRIFLDAGSWPFKLTLPSHIYNQPWAIIVISINQENPTQPIRSNKIIQFVLSLWLVMISCSTLPREAEARAHEMLRRAAEVCGWFVRGRNNPYLVVQNGTPRWCLISLPSIVISTISGP